MVVPYNHIMQAITYGLFMLYFAFHTLVLSNYDKKNNILPYIIEIKNEKKKKMYYCAKVRLSW